MNKNDETEYLRAKLAEYERSARDEKEINRNFISSVSHELRTPVAVLRGSLEALCDGVVSEKEQVEEYHRQMLAESIYLQRLVNDLLEFSRLQNSSFEIFREPVNVPDVVSDVYRSIGMIAEQKNIKMTKSGNDGVFFVNGDYARLRQMFIVVLDNAVKFTSEGGHVEISSAAENGVLTVNITDTGCGIPEDEIKNIFVRFHRVVSAQNRTGSGLGLAIAKEIALRHGADIYVESEVGKGTKFSFVFSDMIDIPCEG